MYVITTYCSLLFPFLNNMGNITDKRAAALLFPSLKKLHFVLSKTPVPM